MKITSTRNPELSISFANAILKPFSPDGGLYIPAGSVNVKGLLLSETDSEMTFAEIVGRVTSALFPDEFSPVEAQEIATQSFSTFSPVLRKFDKQKYLFEMFHGPSGCHRDFGYLWLSKVLDFVLERQGKKAFIVAAGTEKNSRAVAHAFGGAKNIKTFILYPAHDTKSIPEEFLVENGGAIVQATVPGAIGEVEELIRSIYADLTLVEDYSLTIANTMNIGRLLAQTFLFLFCFARLRKKTSDEMYYAIPSGNYGTLTAALYSWKWGMSAKAFFTDATSELNCDENGFCLCSSPNTSATFKSLDPISPSNLERLQDIFKISPTMMRTLIFPSSAKYSSKTVARDLYRRYGVFLDSYTVAAYTAADKNIFFNNLNESNLIVFQKDNPYFDKDFLENACGEIPLKPKFLKPLEKKSQIRYSIATKNDFISVLKSIT